MMRKVALIAAWAALLAAMAGCTSTATNRYREVRIDRHEVVQATTLGPHDVIDVRVYMHKDLSGQHEISPKGQIDFPHVGLVTVEGLTPIAVGQLIRQRLARGYIRNPYVTVTTVKTSSKKVFVLGQVKTETRLPYTDKMSIVEAIVAAGGFGPLAERNYVIVTRAGRRVPVPVEKIMQGLASNFMLQPDDIVYVPESVL